MARTIALTLVLLFVAAFVIALVVGFVVYERNHREERKAYDARRRAEWRDTRPGAKHVFILAMGFFLVGGFGVRLPEEPAWWGWPVFLATFPLIGLYAFLDRRPVLPAAPTDPESYRRMEIGDRADWAETAGPLSDEMLEAVLADDPYVIAEFARAPISTENLAEMHRRVTDPVVREWIATNFNAPLELMAAVPLQRHSVHSAMEFLQRLGIWETHGEDLSALLNAMDDDPRPILEAVRTELGIDIELPAEDE
ncbi:hypothetical protein GCM10011331_18730 [Flavimobilis marinus]|uniref:Uncharacterized protein n=1 Tax=Flavimobilis marinus TaxID=285351 RepID=A0A1I2F2J2_9MICO|nr:hypothetical protein [Flavimobilis marinus]GHG53295.1 hypothetical protein GCM10011331_18730 [Flavimobilis marinus]SFE99375.1 hypothetical protein SAMN04488035_1082 [Flavimobilis marinus]